MGLELVSMPVKGKGSGHLLLFFSDSALEIALVICAHHRDKQGEPGAPSVLFVSSFVSQRFTQTEYCPWGGGQRVNFAVGCDK
jgi:hypothetical protein